MPTIIDFECAKGHVWKDPMPKEEAPIMAKFFGICPLCKTQGTAKGK